MIGWEIRVHWRPAPGVTCPGYTTHAADSEAHAVDGAVSALDGCRHPWALTTATHAEIRPVGGEWRNVPNGRPC